MRITFLGNFSSEHSSETHHVKSLESLGHEVVKLQETQASADLILDTAIESDMFVWVHTHGWQTPGIPMGEVLNKLKNLKIPTISYHLDLWLGLEREKDLKKDDVYKHIQYFFTADKLMADWFNKNTKVKGYFLPAGVLEEETVMLDPIPLDNSPLRNVDVLFVGSKGYHPEHPWRPQLINWLKTNYGTRFWHIGNDGLEVVRGLELNQLYANTKVVVGDSLNIGFDYPYYSSDRLFETLGRGGFLLYPQIKGLSSYFRDGIHLRYYEYGNFKQLKYFIDYYISHDAEREKIRKKGFEEVKKKHTYRHRWEEILRIVSNG